MAESPTVERTRGILLSGREWRIVGVASVLMALNVALMYVLALTPAAEVNDYLFAAPILGVLAYGAALFVGELLAERGVENGNAGIAVLGMTVLQLAFGTLGAGILARVPPDVQVTALGIAAAVTAGITVVLTTYVFARSKSFERWSTYANGAFLLGVFAVAAGTLFPVVLPVGFVFIFLGFLLRLGWEIWRIRERSGGSALLHGIGVYVAVAGVFVHVLQLVLRYVANRG